MAKIPLENPLPDFESLERVLQGKKEAQKVYFVELAIDKEVMEYITENYMGNKLVPLTEETKEVHQRQIINFYYRMGYDFVPKGPGWKNLPQFRKKKQRIQPFFLKAREVGLKRVGV